ncbi:ABC transporter ATP-binding protein [Aquisalibacillus elongatus]|uniref:Putative ABC transport system ATP-binding protein/lipoprotein-releasing system ATP-binding protein n=1 Tax=Aquisalibacillus elongatus TaxID=485577 RepID=A0A3N5B8V6_9BACI|nr:ABC transporter ATP-binding protein [Aquisalibacillus elongatus]RPF53419.1 putative ABC transport system ATP-binding protein/lipoprotein-releasing system ATP-binding protein [Aquisalibacillus elongatus]
MKLNVSNLNKTYQTATDDLQILKNINFTLNEGEWLTILGPSGSGKTTLLQCIAGLLPADEGSVIQYDEFQISDAKDQELQAFRRHQLGFIYQDYKLFDQFHAELNVMLPLVPYQNQDALKSRAQELLEKVHLGDRRHHYPAQLSGGEKQRLAIARALINEPSLLICDEPTGNLDQSNRDQIMDILKELKADGTSVILVTHDRDLMDTGEHTLNLR